ncbi:MAG: SCO family protein [Amphritea sp.]
MTATFAHSANETLKVNYGGAFKLTDHQGNSVTDKDYLGQYMLVYFGYTNCPDICPTGLFTITTAINDLGPKGEQITPLFITIDPQRDTPTKLASYVKAFHPRMVGLSVNTQSTAKAAQAYNVMYSVLQLEDKYLVSHTGQIYLVDPDGQYIDKFNHDIT